MRRVSDVHSAPSKYRSWPSSSGSASHPEPSSITSSAVVLTGTPLKALGTFSHVLQKPNMRQKAYSQ